MQGELSFFPCELKLFSSTGQLVLEKRLQSNKEIIPVNHQKGIYLYQVQKSKEVVKTGKNEVISQREFSNFAGLQDFIPPRDKRDEYKYPNYANEDLDVPTVIRDRRFFSIADDSLAKVQSN